jgi:hypothetical protein
MSRSLTIIFSSLIVGIALSSSIMDDNGRAGYTGSPGEVTCNTTNCHNSFLLNSGNGSVSASCTMVNWNYEPLTTYSISIKVAKPTVNLFGFAAEILSSSNVNAGTIIVTDNVHTQIKTRTVTGVSRRNIVHKLNGGASADSAVFTFNWTAPDTIAGDIIMYFAGNAANANGNVSGDYIYTNTQLISPATVNKTDELITTDPFSVYPNPAKENISLHYSLPKNEMVEVKLYSLSGSLCYSLLKTYKSSGKIDDLIDIPAECLPGLYLLSLESPSGRISRKLMIN